MIRSSEERAWPTWARSDAMPGIERQSIDLLTAQVKQDLDLGSEIRTSIRWLRSAQELPSGAYPGGLEATALAVIAFAESFIRTIEPHGVRTLTRWMFGLNFRMLRPVHRRPMPPFFFAIPRRLTEFPLWVRRPVISHTRAMFAALDLR